MKFITKVFIAGTKINLEDQMNSHISEMEELHHKIESVNCSYSPFKNKEGNTKFSSVLVIGYITIKKAGSI